MCRGFETRPRKPHPPRLAAASLLAPLPLGQVLDPTQDEYDIEDIKNTFIKVLVAATALSFGFALVSDALNLGVCS